MNILYIRNFANKVNPSSYNLQEIGFGKALIKKKFNCDIIYYHEEKEDNIEIVDVHDIYTLRIIWMKGIKFLSNSIYIKVLDHNFLDQYDMVITTEYNQIMTFLLSRKCPEKLILYHGPYADHKQRIIQGLYDKLCLPQIKKGVKYGFVKSDLAKRYLMNKGFQDIKTLGVGLDRENIGEEQRCTELEKTIVSLKNNKVLLYLGILEERRNIIFLLQVLKAIVCVRSDIRLLIVGDGKEEDKDRYFQYIKEHFLGDYVYYLPRVEQKHLWQVYAASDVMMFPTNYDIFGMVLLESMFFKVPIISSLNGGSSTLIKHQVNGFIVEEYNSDIWASQTILLLEDQELRHRIIQAASHTVNDTTWDNIANEMLKQTNSLSWGDYIEKGSTGS